MMLTHEEQLRGCLVGTAVGDSIGLPTEGLSPARIVKRFPGALQQCLIGPWGMCSDDTEHAFFVAQSLITSKARPDAFASSLAWRLRWWFLALPAGVGLATARACIKLWIGFAPDRSGVYSAGNGPAMRAPIIGVFAKNDKELRRELVDASTKLTHTDPKARIGALAVAELAAALSSENALDTGEVIAAFRGLGKGDAVWCELMSAIEDHLRRGAEVEELVTALGLEKGVTGYVYHTVPVVLFVVLRYFDDPALGISQLIACGGDTDTTAAIAGGLFGVAVGEHGFPAVWVASIHNGPLSIEVLRKAGRALSVSGSSGVSWCWPLVPLRNLVFLAIVLGHGFRRLFS